MSETTCKDLCVVIDTNKWRSELLLKSHLGAALLHLMRRRSATMGLPEVVEREIKKHIVRAGDEANAKIMDGFRTIEILMGSRPDYDLPVAADLQRAVEERLGEMKDFVVRIPFRLEHARSALDMVDLELPPNGTNNQQFKDSAIWQAILELSSRYDVVFLTSDKGFFKGREPKNGLADNLRSDYQRVGGRIEVFHELQPLLEALQKDTPPLDKASLTTMIREHLFVHLSEAVAKRGFTLGDLFDSSVSPFATEQIDVLALTFELCYGLADVAQPEMVLRTDASVRVKGDCSYHTDKKALEDMRIDSEEFRWNDPDGRLSTNRNVYAYGGVFVGTRQVRYKLRHPVG